MGMESFFIKVIFLDSKNRIHSLNDAKKAFDRFALKAIKNSDSTFLLEDYFILNIFQENEYFGFSIEGCFSWYKECVPEMYSLLLMLSEVGYKFKMVRPVVHFFEDLSEADFFSIIHQSTNEKYASFIDFYGEINTKILPGEYFYSYREQEIRKAKRERNWISFLLGKRNRIR